MDEEQLISLVRQAASGDREAFDALVLQFEPLVIATALRRLRNEAEAGEVAQDVFVQAFRKLPQLREPERFAGWLRRIAVRMSINRAVRRPKESLFNPHAFSVVRAERANPLDGLVREEQSVQIRGGLRRLRKLDRQTLIAFYFKGQSLKQMSVEFNSPVGTIKRRLHTARNRLRDELSELQPA
jgi:RNA polymerase sigma-70 factor (ECF subfamily)